MGRVEEMELLRSCVKRNVDAWRAWGASSTMPAQEGDKHAYRHPAVVGARGVGKTAFMQRGLVKMMEERFEDTWTGRAFAWNLAQTPLTVPEKKQFLGAQGVPANAWNDHRQAGRQAGTRMASA